MLLVLDNYDSFVHNLARYLRRLGHDTQVVRSDQLSVDDVRDLDVDAIILSPGPKTPLEAGCCLDVVSAFAGEIPMLGVCLGHQVIAHAFGGRIVQTGPVHGMPSLVHHRGDGLFAGLPNPFRAGRYHSLVADADALPGSLSITAWTTDETVASSDRIVMGIEHCDYPIFGVQFHPESILTEYGNEILINFLHLAGLWPAGESVS